MSQFITGKQGGEIEQLSVLLNLSQLLLLQTKPVTQLCLTVHLNVFSEASTPKKNSATLLEHRSSTFSQYCISKS